MINFFCVLSGAVWFTLFLVATGLLMGLGGIKLSELWAEWKEKKRGDNDV